MSSLISQLKFTQQFLTRYGMSTYLIFGNLGLLLNMIIFTRPVHRRNPTSLYILSMTFCAFFGLNIAVIPTIYSLDHPNPTSSSLVFCKIQYHLRHAFNQLMRTFIIFACVDRYAICNRQGRIHSFSQYKIAIRTILSIFAFWFLVSIFPAMLQTIVNGTCGVFDVLHDLLFTIYIILAVNVIPLISMITFGSLIFMNLKETRARVRPIKNANTAIGGLRKRDRDMMKMLLFELLGFILTTVPGTIIQIYLTATKTTNKSTDHQQIESFASFLTRGFSLYLNNCFSFWIYISVSQSFRSEFKTLMRKGFALVVQRPIEIHEQN